MLLPLPTTISSCLSTIRWPLGPGSSPPMVYEPLDALKSRRSTSNAAGTASPIEKVIFDVPGAVASLTPSGATSDQQQNAALSVALLLLGHGYADECHDLVTPLSWGDDTHFGGPSVRSTATPSVISSASYVHSLVHRREAFNVGEYGMVGFSNANYWSNAAHRSSGSGTIPYGDMRRAILEASGQFGQEAKDWCQERIVEEGGDDEEYWESRALHELCAQVSRGDGAEENFRGFAEQASVVELRVLLRHCLNGAGYECPSCLASGGANSVVSEVEKVNRSCSKVNQIVALRAGGKVSSAHMSSFRNNGSIAIRNVLSTGRDGAIDSESAESAAAGIAARLLESPAVCQADDTDGEFAICIFLPPNEKDALDSADGIGSAGGGGSLAPGDVFATRNCADILDTACQWRRYTACSKDNPVAIFVDSLYGSKGETPTTVIQWSKGTVHYKSQ